MEEWRNVDGYEGIYKVSNYGKVARCIENNKLRLLKTTITQFGYERVVLSKKGKSKNFLVHRLVAFAFVKKKENSEFVNHKDGNKTNNIYSNLEWVTNRENVIHAYENKLKKKIDFDKDEMQLLYVDKRLPICKIAKMKGCSPTTLKTILQRQGFHIRNTSECQTKFNISEEFLSKELKVKSQNRIAKELGCSRTTILRLRGVYGLDINGNKI